MTTVTDAELFVDANRVKGKVVLITGAANGIGKATALLFGKYGAKVVIGDLDIEGAEAVAAEITASGSEAVAKKCDVTSWDQQLSLFLFAMSTFHQIDIVVPNAGVSERGNMSEVQRQAVNGFPTKPDMVTLEINLISVIYTARLGLYYLLSSNSEELKSMVFMGSMASMEAIPTAPLYSTAKHGIIGFMGALYGEYRTQIRFAVICPWFVDTAIVPTHFKLLMSGIPLTPISRVAGAIFKAATELDPETNGALWTLPDDGPVLRLDRVKMHFDQGIYKLLNDRIEAGMKLASAANRYYATFKDIYRIIGKKVLIMTLSLGMGYLAWKSRAVWVRV